MNKLCVDLCSGLGGFSRAFVDAGWEVITVDIDPKFNPTICADIRGIEAKFIELHIQREKFSAYEKVVVLASPPCERFSFAPRSWPMKGIREALEIVGSILELIAEIKPNYWLVENPRGYLEAFMSAKPRMRIKLSNYGSKYAKPTLLWSNFSLDLVKEIGEPTMAVSVAAKTRRTRLPVLTRNPSERAKMPYGLSQAVLEAIA